MQTENPEEKQETGSLSRPWMVLPGVLVLASIVCLIVIGSILFGSPEPDSDVVTIQPAEGERPTSPAEEGVEPLFLPTATGPMSPQKGGRSAGDPYIFELGNTGYDVQRYTLQLALDPAVEHVQGTAIVEAISTLHGLSQLTLDFAGLQIGAVTVDGRTASFSRQGKKVIVDLPKLLPQGASFSMVISYQGRSLNEPSAYLLFADYLGMVFPDGQSLYTISEPDGARNWFPANDHPRDKATFRFELVVPDGLTAIANGRLLETRSSALPNGDLGRLFIWEHNYPMAPYLAIVAVGPYVRLEGQTPKGIPIRHYTFPELENSVVAATSIVPEALDWMSDLLGPYPFETFGIATARISGGSMESQTMILLSDALIGKQTVMHELAHMWFGDWVSLDSWGEMWRNEGFATYFQLMWETGDDPEAMALRVASLQSVVEGNDKHYPLLNPPPQYLFDLNIYFQGAVVVHALREEVGDDAFFTGLRAYFSRYGGKTASDAQFQAVMEESAGISLDPFFSQWFSSE
jgi:aminopeptidase N